jgi:phosphate/sulfate permease
MELFPDSLFFRIVWPTIWFGLWHYVPVSVSSDESVVGMIIGSGLMGFYLSFLAKKTGTIWWNILAHTIGGFIMIM